MVRYGIRSPDDPTVLSTLKVIDAVLRTDTLPAQPGTATTMMATVSRRTAAHSTNIVWAAYGLCSAESAAIMSLPPVEAPRPTSEPWRVLLQRPVSSLNSPGTTRADSKSTCGSAMPLMWAHAEYIKLLRSTADGKVYDTVP